MHIKLGLVFLLLAQYVACDVVFHDKFDGKLESYNPDAGTGNWTYFPGGTGFLNGVDTEFGKGRTYLTHHTSRNTFPKSTLSAFANVDSYVSSVGLLSGSPFQIEEGKSLSMSWVAAINTESTENNLAQYGVSDNDMRRGSFEILIFDIINGQSYAFFITGTEVYVSHNSNSLLGSNVKSFDSLKLVATKKPMDVNEYEIVLNRDARTVKWYMDGNLLEQETIGSYSFKIVTLTNDTKLEPPYAFFNDLVIPAMATIRFPQVLDPRPDIVDDRAFFNLYSTDSELLIPSASEYLLDDFTCYDSNGSITTDPTMPANCPLFNGVKVTAEILDFKVMISNLGEGNSQ